MSHPVYRAGIIGCGRIGADVSTSGPSRIRCHAAAYQASPRVRLVAASDTDSEALSRAGQRWGISRLYTDYRQMLEREDLDLVSVCTPTVTHGQVLRDLLRSVRGYGILMEKPVAATPEEARQFLRWSADSSAVVAVNYGRRFCPVYQQAAQEIREGRLGRIQFVHAVYTNGLYNNGTHLLDLLRWMVGDPQALTPMERVKEGPDPTWSVRVVWPDGTAGWLQAVDPDAYTLFELDLVGTEGRYRFVDQGHWLERYRVEEATAEHGFRQLSADPAKERTDLDGSVRYALEDLIQAMERGRAPACTLEDGMAALELARRALSGARGDPLVSTV